MRKVLSGYCRTSPDQLQFAAEKFGKPVLKDERSSFSVHFNLSHSRNLAVLAVSRDNPVGVDIEYRRTISDMECVARRFFSKHEYDQWKRLSRQHQNEAFYRCWTRKEAIIKNSGMGLSARLDTFDVSLNPYAPPTVLGGSHAGFDADCWQLADPKIHDQYEVAVALCSGEPVVIDYQGVYG
jgi:4'-phosphopantetheinyl transferase